ncbi:peroxidase [Capsulimonas corticalis]|uniref:Peroxidase n=1 Tax=Capsulimonas corticalis TaxID=2219043 RepID=A0A402CSG6_9BACT|nr:peroxidase [Capsulimonas corticalis]BDI31088.1 peroxidase [Capsulimonas corticalis]
MPAFDLSDIQGNILRGYGMDFVRIFALRIDDAPAARRLIGDLASGEARSLLKVTTAATWSLKPMHAINAGVTAEGLKLLGASDASIASFPQEFTAPMAERAPLLGDIGESAPENWIPGLACSVDTPSQVHLVLIAHARTGEMQERLTPLLRERFLLDGACTELAVIDGADLPDSRVHFGYLDGIAEPRIEGGGGRDPEDDQPLIPAGEFVLGHPGLSNARYPTPQPDALGVNGSFLALRILKQDVDGFEKFLEENAARVPAKPGVDAKELLAAKMCGRWRNGLPLALSPDTDCPDPPIPQDQWNKFDYVKSEALPEVIDDSYGIRCPIGSHIRRNNPRSGVVAGGGGHNHRLVRRGIPYGAPYDPARPNDGVERGLVGLFFCGSLGNQFEFLMTEWINSDSFGLRGDLDPLMAGNDPATSRFVIPVSNLHKESIVITGLSRFISTRASVYCFMPSVTALKYLANL